MKNVKKTVIDKTKNDKNRVFLLRMFMTTEYCERGPGAQVGKMLIFIAANH